MNKKHYTTVGKTALLQFLSSHPDCQFTAEELCRAIHGEACNAKSSIYRQLSTLCKEGSVRKFTNPESKFALFQYVGSHCDCDGHFHEKCLRCGKIEHLDCHASSEFFEHLLKEHGFEVYCGQSILYGLCASCREGGKDHA